jgi:manganese/zinc/iron transport system permease protein
MNALSALLPDFDARYVFILPWTENLAATGSWMLMGFFVAAACGLVGNYLMLRRMALMGDAVSHSVLPGLVIAFLLTGSRSTGAMFLGALLAGVATAVIVETIHRKTRVKQDASIGVTFTTLFAIGVVLVSIYSSQIDLDAECVLYGEIGFLPPLPSFASLVGFEKWAALPTALVRMGGVLLLVGALIAIFYKELLVSSFDPGLARSLGINTTAMHYGLMLVLSVVVVSAFEAVGSILVVAMLILPGATASLLTTRLARVHALSLAHAAVSAVLGVHLALALGCQIGPAMVVAGAGLFTVAWIFSPTQGLLRRWRSGSELALLTPRHPRE